MNKILITSFSIAGSTLLLLTGIIGAHHISQAKAHYSHEYNIERTTSNQYQNVLTRRKTKLAKKITYKHDTNYIQWTRNSFYHLRLDNITEAFFNRYYNFTNRAEVLNRPKLENKYISKNLRNNTGIFLYMTDIHNNIGSHFKNVNNYIVNTKGNNIIDIADVKYSAWLTKGENKNHPNTGEKWYILCYNTKNNKITSLKPYYREDNIKIPNFKL